jgi:excisionase family DNA binding protein
MFMSAATMARTYGIHVETVRRWLATGRLRGHRLGEKHSHWRIQPADAMGLVERLLRKRPPARIAVRMVSTAAWPD